MIPVDELLYETFSLKADKIGKLFYEDIPLEDKLLILNQAQIEWVKSRNGLSNMYKEGFEDSLKRIDDINSVLLVRDKELELSKIGGVYNTYVYDMKLIKNYMLYKDSYAMAIKDCCNERPIFNNMVTTGDLSNWYWGDNTKPSFDWQEQLISISENTLEIHTDSDYELTTMFITYIRYPKRIDKKGITWFDGSPSKDQDCELPYYTKNDISDWAVKMVGMYLENPTMVQTAQERIMNNE